jgi:HSP20 family protein
LDDFFNNFFSPAVPFEDGFLDTKWAPKVDIIDEDDSIVVKAELPGVDKKDINVDVKDRVLTIKGERSDEKEVNEDNFYRRERCHGSFQRSFSLPLDSDPTDISAEFKDGILTVSVPKPEEKKPRQITVH